MRRGSRTLAFAVVLLALVDVGAQGPQAVPAPAVQTGGRPGLPPRDAAAPQTGTGRIRGRVYAADTSAGLRRAQVTLNGAEGNVRRFVTTDAEGRYEFSELPAGRYNMVASKGGYVSLQYGQQRPFEPGRPITIDNGQALTQIDIALPRGSVIAGRVTDEFGEPIAGAVIQVQRYQFMPGGQRRLTYAGGQGFVQTDDLGQFRVYGLMPGEYIVSANARNGLGPQQGASANDVSEGYAPTYYPGTISPAEAQPINVGLAQETLVQFTLQASRMARISGTVVDAEGKPAIGATLMVRTGDGGGTMTMMAGRSGVDGSFTLANVAPGNHYIDVRLPPRGANIRGEAGTVPVSVGADNITGLRITTGHGATIKGRVVFEGSSARATGTAQPRVLAQSADPQNQGNLFFPGAAGADDGRILDDGTFQIGGASGTVFFRAINAPDWMLKSVTLDGEDVTDVPYELTNGDAIDNLRIVLTDRLTDVAGGVSTERGQAVKDYVVVVQPEEPKPAQIAGRYVQTARPDQDGRFRVRRLPPGRYVITALEALEEGRQWDPEYQPKLRDAGKRFSIKEGESIVLDLKLSDGL